MKSRKIKKIKPQGSYLAISIVWGLVFWGMLSGCSLLGCKDSKSQKLPEHQIARVPLLVDKFTPLFIGRIDTVGSPNGPLPSGAQAASPDGKFLARIGEDGKKVELLDAKTKKLLNIISSPGENDPKAFAFSSDGSQLAVLYNEGNPLNHINTIMIFDLALKQFLKVIRFVGRDWYHEMIFYNDGRIALLLAWQGIGAVIDPKTNQPVPVEGTPPQLPVP